MLLLEEEEERTMEDLRIEDNNQILIEGDTELRWNYFSNVNMGLHGRMLAWM